MMVFLNICFRSEHMNTNKKKNNTSKVNFVDMIFPLFHKITRKKYHNNS